MVNDLNSEESPIFLFILKTEIIRKNDPSCWIFWFIDNAPSCERAEFVE